MDTEIIEQLEDKIINFLLIEFDSDITRILEAPAPNVPYDFLIR